MVWWFGSRRKKILASAFPKSWWELILSRVPYAKCLTRAEKKHYQYLVKVFVAEKKWEGCGGLELTDEIRVTIAAMACLLILNLKENLYRHVLSILVYPATVIPPQRPIGAFEVPMAPIKTPEPILGEAHMRGPVILVWDEILREARHQASGHNVVYHEFAHQLDFLDGSANGAPPLESQLAYQEWYAVCTREFQNLRAAVEHGKPTLLDDYGAVNEAEFFAVATELFFDRPGAMHKRYPELYAALKNFYHQDPAARV